MKITEYLQYHDKGAGGVCQVSFFVSNGCCQKLYKKSFKINHLSSRLE
ncbi:hypothetical protein [Wolbachia endosymbiont (group A) of Pogonocherus hispidulus]